MSSFPSLRAGRKNPGDPFLTVSLFNFSSKCPVMNLKCFSTSYIKHKDARASWNIVCNKKA